MKIQEFTFELGALRRDLEELGSQGPLVMSRAVNRAITSGRAAMSKAIAADTGLGSRFIKEEIKIVQKAQRSNPVAAVEVLGRRLPLIAFQARGPEPSRGRGRGVSYRLPGGRGRVPDAFIATMRSGHRGVYRRKPGARRHGKPPTRPQLPIFELRGPSLPHVFEKQFPVFRQAAEDALLKNLTSEISFERSKASE